MTAQKMRSRSAGSDAGARRIASLTLATADAFVVIRDRTLDPLVRWDAARTVSETWSTSLVPGSFGARRRLADAEFARALEQGASLEHIRAGARQLATFCAIAPASSSSAPVELMRRARSELLAEFGVTRSGWSAASIDAARVALSEDSTSLVDHATVDAGVSFPPITAAPSWPRMRRHLTSQEAEMVAAYFETLSVARAAERLGLSHGHGRVVMSNARRRLAKAGLTDPRGPDLCASRD